MWRGQRLHSPRDTRRRATAAPQEAISECLKCAMISTISEPPGPMSPKRVPNVCHRTDPRCGLCVASSRVPTGTQPAQARSTARNLDECLDSGHGSRMSAGLCTTAESSEPLLCPYCGRQLRWATTRWLAHGVFECERCGEFPDFRVSRRETLPGEPSPSFDSPDRPAPSTD